MLAVLGLSALLTTGAAFARDEKQGQAPGHTATENRKADVTYGRVKELTAGQKVVIDVDNAMDKSYDMTDKDLSMKMASGLKVGWGGSREDHRNGQERQEDGEHREGQVDAREARRQNQKRGSEDLGQGQALAFARESVFSFLSQANSRSRRADPVERAAGFGEIVAIEHDAPARGAGNLQEDGGRAGSRAAHQCIPHAIHP